MSKIATSQARMIEHLEALLVLANEEVMRLETALDVVQYCHMPLDPEQTSEELPAPPKEIHVDTLAALAAASRSPSGPHTKEMREAVKQWRKKGAAKKAKPAQLKPATAKELSDMADASAYYQQLNKELADKAATKVKKAAAKGAKPMALPKLITDKAILDFLALVYDKHPVYSADVIRGVGADTKPEKQQVYNTLARLVKANVVSKDDKLKTYELVEGGAA